jgi:hypothetical protein
MGRVSAVLLSLAAATGMATTLAWAAMTQSPSGIDNRLRFEWETAQARGGQPLIAGYLYNDYKRPAMSVVVSTEALDASGQVVRRTLNVLPGIVPAFGRTYFELSPDAVGASYRIAVTSFEWYAGSN